MDSLIKKIQKRSFWLPGSEQFLLPDRNLMRPDYLSELNQLEDVNLVVGIMGQRRSGKSVIGRQYIKKLRDEGVPGKNILYLNFFLKPIVEILDEKNFMALVEWWMENCVDKSRPSLLFLDEVQELENWDDNVASVFEDPALPCRIIITGSNSRMLSEDFSDKLGGRYTTLQVFPFSFAEYCRFTKRDVSADNVESYLWAGGMPEVLKVEDEELRMRLLSDIINSTVKNDIITRLNISNPGLLFALIEFCRSSFSQEISIKNITNTVLQNPNLPKGKTRFQTTSSLISKYIGYLQDVYFLYSPSTYSYRTKDILKRGVDKIYLSDVSMADYKVKTQKGYLFENMVYIELLRNRFKVQRFLGYRNRNLEIDFLAEKKSVSFLLQVCWQLGDKDENPELWGREFGNLHQTRLDVPKFVISLDKNIRSPFSDVKHLNIESFLDWVVGKNP